MRRPTTGTHSSHGAPLDSDFQKLELGRRILYLRRSLIRSAAEIVASLGKLDNASGAGNRRSGFALKLADDVELFVRLSRRGGLARHLFSDIYLGMHPRPVRELTIAAEAFRRGIPIVEPAGALVEWLAPFAYRGAFLTRALAGMTLWDFLRTDDDAQVRMHVLGQARQAIEKMHRLGLLHADLNLHNLHVTTSRDSFGIAILDLDKARLFRQPVSKARRQRNLERLRRSVLKLDPQGRYLDQQATGLLTSL
jgi:tRNA A-37 threonylcarbamoyl transferase component Bud32